MNNNILQGQHILRNRTRVRVRYDRIIILTIVLALAFLAGVATNSIIRSWPEPCSWHAPMEPIEGCSYIPLKDS